MIGSRETDIFQRLSMGGDDLLIGWENQSFLAEYHEDRLGIAGLDVVQTGFGFLNIH